MHPWYMSEIAFEVSRERQRAGERLARPMPVAPRRPAGPARRWLARIAAVLSRGLASTAVRLEDGVHVADVGRSPGA